MVAALNTIRGARAETGRGRPALDADRDLAEVRLRLEVAIGRDRVAELEDAIDDGMYLPQRECPVHVLSFKSPACRAGTT